LFLGKSTKTAVTRAALFDSNMHQIVCRLALRPRPHWGAYSASPDPLAVLREGDEERGVKGRKGDRRKGKGRGWKGGSLSFALGRTKKSRRLCTDRLILATDNPITP